MKNKIRILKYWDKRMYICSTNIFPILRKLGYKKIQVFNLRRQPGNDKDHCACTRQDNKNSPSLCSTSCRPKNVSRIKNFDNVKKQKIYEDLIILKARSSVNGENEDF